MIEWVRDNMDTLIEEMAKVSAPTAVSLQDDEREKVRSKLQLLFYDG